VAGGEEGDAGGGNGRRERGLGFGEASQHLKGGGGERPARRLACPRPALAEPATAGVGATAQADQRAREEVRGRLV
jgi:hypothetical protein